MQKISYVNGKYLSHKKAAVNIDDRGFQFADGVYEVIYVRKAVLIDGEQHFARLKRSCNELAIEFSVAIAALTIIIEELIRRNGLEHGCIYIQVTRGIAERYHDFPVAAKPSLIITFSRAKLPTTEQISRGVAVMTLPDLRWKRRDVKSIALLANVLAKNQASAHNCRDAWLYEENGEVTEGSATNCYIVKNKQIITHQLDNKILAGVTRDSILKLARHAGMVVLEQAFSVEDARNADEAFISGSTIGILSVTKIDDKLVSDGKPGTITIALAKIYEQYVQGQLPQ
jgi:D-alanine transaminase